MVKKTITYTDYNDNQRTETFYFNLSQSELVELSAKYDDFTEIAESNNPAKIMPMIKNIILMAYGKKSEDGKRFIKSEALSLEFYQSEAYSTLFMGFVTNPDEFMKFVEGITPHDINKAAAPAITMA